MARLAGKTVVVAGAASGIGRAVAELFATEGAATALFLAGEEAAFVIGAALAVDGGFTAQ